MDLPIITALANLVPNILPFFSKDETTNEAVQLIADTAKTITGATSEEEAFKILKSNPESLLKYQEAINLQVLSMYQEETKRLEGINQTMRSEVVSSDAYVRRMRPTFGYIMAATWAVQMGAIAYTIIKVPAKASEIITSMASMTTIWSVGLAVLGVYVYKRSQEKTYL